jgi:hypothetical protein
MKSLFLLTGTALLIFGGILTARSKNRRPKPFNGPDGNDKTNKFKQWIYFKSNGSELNYYAFNPLTKEFIEVINIMDRYGINIRNSDSMNAERIIKDYFNECRLELFRIYEKTTESNFVHAFNSVNIELTKSFEKILTKHFNS